MEGALSRRDFIAGAGGVVAGLAAPSAVAGAAPGCGSGLRGAFCLPADAVFLNCASLGPSPRVALEAMQRASLRLARDPVGEAYGVLLQDAESVRADAAALLGCDIGEVSVSGSTTDGMNRVAQGIALRPGDRVLTTDQEHPGGSVCWEHLAQTRGIVVDRVALPRAPATPGESGRVVLDGLRPRTRVVSVSHVTYTTGLRLPVGELAQAVHEHGALLVVDGAQAPVGARLDVGALGCDAYATSGHKWLLAPAGTGLLVVRERARDHIRPLALARGPGVYTAAGGVPGLAAILGMGASLDLLAGIGLDEAARHVMGLRAALLGRLSDATWGRCVSPADPLMGAPIVSVELPAGRRAGDVVRELRERFRVHVRAVDSHGWNALRVSLHVYNTVDDLDRFMDACGTLL